MKKLSSAIIIILAMASAIRAAPSEPFGFTKPVSEEDGDSIATAQISVSVCPGTSCPTLLSPAITNRTNRRRTFINTGSYNVCIGTNTTTLLTSGYLLMPSTGTVPSYYTYSTSAFYAVAAATDTVAVIQEYNIQP